MNDFFKKIISEREERFKTFDQKKKIFDREVFNDSRSELNEKKSKRDAMSHYQEDKNHHKKSSNYGDYSQWNYFGQQDIPSSNSHSRRGHFSFSGASQQHSLGWNPMGIGIPRQTNPYYTNPHTHMMPAHAHSDFRYNQWNNPNHKSIPNIQNAHSQNSALPQGKVDNKHHTDITHSPQDLGSSIGSTSEFAKFRPTSRDLMHRVSSNIPEKSTRGGLNTDHLASASPALRNSSIRTPSISSFPKVVINNPLSDLHMLVTTNQEGEKLPQKSENFQQESVDLSAHSENNKQKENVEDKSLNGSSRNLKEFRSPVSVIQIQNKLVKSDLKECEKPVELTSKSTEKIVDLLISPSLGRSDVDKKVSSDCLNEDIKETVQNKIEKICEEPIKASVIVGKDEESLVGGAKNEADIPKIGQSDSCKNLSRGMGKTEVEEEIASQKSVKFVHTDCLNENDSQNMVSKEAEETHNKETNEERLSRSNTECSKESETLRDSKRKAEDELVSDVKKKVLSGCDFESGKTCEDSERENLGLSTVTSTSVEAKPTVNEVIKKIPKKKPTRKSRVGRLSSGQSSGSERSLSFKKSKSLGNKEDVKKKIKRTLCDVVDRRGPFLHVEGPKESPASVVIVNFPKGDDEDDKEKSSAKKQILNASRTKHHNELDYRGRSRNGMYSSTLSARYDAHTTDYTWVCVFCKKGPHYSTMGDLYGPYIISKDESSSVGDFSGDEKDISDAQKRGGRNKKSIRSNNMVEHFQKMSRKLRRTQSAESCLTGMTVISDDQIDQLRYEVWVHEQCAVWSPNVFLIGSRIIGMKEAIWCSVKTICSKCGISGANIGCVYRNCPNRSHYHCAKESGWSLEQKTFISTCHIHKPRS